jgi:uncharacterized oligopeptide transporter (OPT) family protein
MPLFQRAPQTAEEVEESRPHDLSPDAVNELDEDAWYERVYRGDDAPQLTVRAVGMGAMLGFFLALANLYIGLKIGWHLGVNLTACILSFSIWAAIHKAGLARTPMTILENNCMASTASAAGYSTGNIMVASIPALFLLTGTALPWLVTAVWVLCLAALGVSLAIPMKRNMVNREKLRFPSGTAAAVLLKSLHEKGGDAIAKGRALLYTALAAGVVPLLKDLEAWKGIGDKGQIVRHALLPASLKILDWLPQITAAGKKAALSAWNVKLDYGPALIGAGMLVGVRVTLSMVAGGLFVVFFLGPAAMEATWTNPAGAVVAAAKGPASAWRDIGIWVGAPLMVSSSILTFALDWRTIARAFSGLGQGGAAARSSAIEVPSTWFYAGASLSALGIVVVAQRWFGVPVHYGVVAVLMTFVLALVACRATGESDITPTGAMGKIMQLAYGIFIPQNATANLMTAGITGGASSASADLLTDLKSGYLLGANPRRQFMAQLMGVLPGTVATVLGYSILVPDASVFTGSEGRDPAFPAPAAQSWLAVARVFKEGINNLHPMARQGIFYGLAAGAILVLLERALPRYKKWLPSPTGIGLGLILPFYQPLAMFIGALVAALAGRKKGSRLAELVVPIASGLIAGESIVGVVVAGLNNFVLK